MVSVIEAREKHIKKAELSPVQQATITEYLPSYVYFQAINVFNRNVQIKSFVPNGRDYREYRYVTAVTAGRVIGQVLHDQLITPEGAHYFDAFYRGDLLDLTKSLLEIDELYPASDPNDAYTGNALLDSTQRFPIHVDTEGTVSAVVLFPVDARNPTDNGTSLPMRFRGGELVISLNPRAVGYGQILRAPNKLIIPDQYEIKMACFDATDKPHGSTPIHPDSPPRYTIACTYFRPGYGPEKRSAEFRRTRS